MASSKFGETEECADGLVLIGDDSRMIGRKQKLEISKNFRVESFDTSIFRGIIGFKKGKQTVKINLTCCTDPQIALLITKPGKMDYKIIKDSFCIAFGNAIMDLDALSKTQLDYKSGNPCCRFAPEIWCSTCSHGTVKIQSKDVEKFAKSLIEGLKITIVAEKKKRLQKDKEEELKNLTEFQAEERIQTYMQEAGYNIECVFAIYEIGQSENFTDYISKLTFMGFQPQFAKVAILHVARDYSKADKCLLWNFEAILGHKIKDQTIPGKIKTFYNYMTYGHGNVNYDQTVKAGYDTIHQSKIHFATLKFYTSSFKEMHRDGLSGFRKWKNPIVEKALTNARPLLGIEEPEQEPDDEEHDDDVLKQKRREERQLRQPKDVMTCIAAVQTFFKSLENTNHNIARMEAIIVIPEKHLVGESREGIWKKFDDYFGKMLGPRMVEANWINEYDYEQFKKQLKDTIIKAVNTLTPIVESTIRKRDKGDWLGSIPTPGEIRTMSFVVTAEVYI